MPRRWDDWIAAIPLIAALSSVDRRRLTEITRVIVAEKRWTGCDGLTVTDEMKVTIAAQAALLILHIEDDYFADVREVLIYPTTMAVPTERRDGYLVHAIDMPTFGQAMAGGPIALSWESVQGGIANEDDARNVVLHEFAHKLDMLDHDTDGTPPLNTSKQYRDWHTIMTREYEALVEAAHDGRATLLDHYGATNPPEFFAVATEVFFENPRSMRRQHEALYHLLADYYQQDPARRE